MISYRSAYLKLETDSSHVISNLKSSLHEALVRLKAYDELENEVDAAIVRAGAGAGLFSTKGHKDIITGAGVDNNVLFLHNHESKSSLLNLDNVDENTENSSTQLFNLLRQLPTNPDRRIKQSVQLAQQLLQSESIKNEALLQVNLLQSEAIVFKKRIESLEIDLSRTIHPTSYLVAKLRDTEDISITAQNKVKSLESELTAYKLSLSRVEKEKEEFKERLSTLLQQRNELDKLRSLLEVWNSEEEEEEDEDNGMGEEDMSFDEEEMDNEEKEEIGDYNLISVADNHTNVPSSSSQVLTQEEKKQSPSTSQQHNSPPTTPTPEGRVTGLEKGNIDPIMARPDISHVDAHAANLFPRNLTISTEGPKQDQVNPLLTLPLTNSPNLVQRTGQESSPSSSPSSSAAAQRDLNLSPTLLRQVLSPPSAKSVKIKEDLNMLVEVGESLNTQKVNQRQSLIPSPVSRTKGNSHDASTTSKVNNDPSLIDQLSVVPTSSTIGIGRDTKKSLTKWHTREIL